MLKKIIAISIVLCFVPFFSELFKPLIKLGSLAFAVIGAYLFRINFKPAFRFLFTQEEVENRLTNFLIALGIPFLLCLPAGYFWGKWIWAYIF